MHILCIYPRLVHLNVQHSNKSLLSNPEKDGQEADRRAVGKSVPRPACVRTTMFLAPLLALPLLVLSSPVHPTANRTRPLVLWHGLGAHALLSMHSRHVWVGAHSAIQATLIPHPGWLSLLNSLRTYIQMSSFTLSTLTRTTMRTDKLVSCVPSA